jgi:hypothetical protein
MSTIYPGLNNDIAERAHTVGEFVALGNKYDNYDYKRFSLIENIDDVPYIVHNVLDDYIDLLKERAVLVTLSSEEVAEYQYNTKKLSWKLYDTTQFYHIILRINDLASTHDFNLSSKTIKLIHPDLLKDTITTIYFNERTTIGTYNAVHSNDSKITTNVNDRLRGTK